MERRKPISEAFSDEELILELKARNLDADITTFSDEEILDELDRRELSERVEASPVAKLDDFTDEDILNEVEYRSLTGWNSCPDLEMASDADIRAEAESRSLLSDTTFEEKKASAVNFLRSVDEAELARVLCDVTGCGYYDKARLEEFIKTIK